MTIPVVVLPEIPTETLHPPTSGPVVAPSDGGSSLTPPPPDTLLRVEQSHPARPRPLSLDDTGRHHRHRSSLASSCRSSLEEDGVVSVMASPHGMPSPQGWKDPVLDSAPRILIVDDNRLNLRVLTKQLQSLLVAHEGCQDGVHLETASNGKEAVDRVRQRLEACHGHYCQAYSLILMDCQMPVMDGCTAARHIRQLEAQQKPAGPRIPIVACTANALPEHLEEIRDAGMDGLLTKPFLSNDLVQILQEHAHSLMLTLPSQTTAQLQ